MKKLSILTILLLPALAVAAPKAPIELTLQALSGEAVKVNWKNGDDSIFDGPTGYKIYRNGEFLTATRQSCYSSESGSTNEVCSFIDHNLAANTEYSYTVVASDDEHFANDTQHISSTHKDFNYFAISKDKTKAYSKYTAGGDGWDDEVDTFIKITDISNPDAPQDTGFSYQPVSYTYKLGDNKGKTVKGTVQSKFLSKDGSRIFILTDYGLENDTSDACTYCETAYFINYLTILDSSDLSVLSQSEFHEKLTILGTSSDGKKLYVESKLHTLTDAISKKVIDISDASNPTIAQTQDFPNLVTSGNGKLYAVDNHAKFSILDEISKAELGSISEIEYYYRNLTLSPEKDTIYAVGSSRPEGGFLQLIDVRDSRNPTIISTIDTPNGAEDVVISADAKKAYIGHRDGIEVVDISNPHRLKVIHRIFIDHGVDKMNLIGDSKIIASSGSSMYVIDISSF